jgi:general nucleoside transport system ATP-binding protein
MTDTASSSRSSGTGQDHGESARPALPLLELSGIQKRFPGVLANDDVALAIRAGEIHALLGENGAGKSTLVKIICGVLRPEAGTIYWHGEHVEIANPAAARRLGIGVVFQHFSLFDGLTAAENIALGIDDASQRRNLKRRIAAISAEYGLSVHPDRAVHDLSVGERQRIEIVRALLQDPKLLIMDEPTSVLTPQEVEQLFVTLRRLASEGRAILYISHKLEEITALCQRATVMRLGRVVAECDPRRETARRLAELMVGGELKTPQRRKSRDRQAAARLAVNGLSLRSEERFGTDLKDVAFAVAGGEIVGIAGVAGNGQAELMAALTGETLAENPAAIVIDGTPAGQLGPAARRLLGAAFVPEERNGHGAVGEMTLAENAFLSAHRRLKLVRHGLIDERGAADFADTVIRRFDVRTSGPAAKARSLSGGNLQKFIVGREILQKPGVLVISQPSWGLDAGAAAAVAQALLDLAEAGAAVLIISQDLDEILSLSDRIAVIHHGALSAARPVHDVTAQEIGLLMGGVNTPGSDEAERAHPA